MHSTFSTIGLDDHGAALDRSSLFPAAGLDWPDGADMEFDLGRFTHYPFSVDVSNNRLLAALDRSGQIRRAVVATGIDDVRGKSIPGVYINKRLAFCEGHIGLDVFVDGRQCQTPGLHFIDGVIPEFTSRIGDVNVSTTLFAPQIDTAGNETNAVRRPLCILQLGHITNNGDDAAHITLICHNETSTKETTQALPCHVALINATQDGRRRDPSATLPASDKTKPHGTTLDVPAGLSVTFGFVADFTSDGANLACFHTTQTIDDALESTLAARHGTMGSLTVPEDPWYGEMATRAVELARQSMLLLDDGRAAGSFWGSNANPLPDVWTRDFSYGAMGLVENNPELACAAIDFLARYGIPEMAWQREARMHPKANGFEHSLGNACLGAVLASMLVQRHGRASLKVPNDTFTGYIRKLAGNLIECKPAPGELYTTLYISDGPSRGDFHTGSNILAWKAATALTHDFADLLEPQQCEELSGIAAKLGDALSSRCVRNVCGVNMFVEGVDRDGTVIGVHDGEESDLTLASVYGFTDRDDPRIRAHAQWAHSTDDPYYAPITGGIDFWDFDDSNGITYPGTIHGLCTAGSRHELSAALHRIRRTTDVDGSFWWWPFEHAESDPSRVKRGLGKCGWCAGEYVAFLIHDIAGIRRDEDAQSITVAPYAPWREFSWDGMEFCGGTIGMHLDGNSLTFTNSTPETLNATLQIALQPGEMLEDVDLDGQSRRYQAEVVYLRDCAAVKVHESVASGQSVTLHVKTRTA